MTEEEAETKWCPFARERARQGMPDGGGNRIPYGCADDGPVEEDYIRDAAMAFPCIGSACMAWRWAEVVTAWSSSPNSPHEAVPREYGRSGIDGYCGLSGRP